ncbi:MAG: glycoside hydrolase family 127 protein, partial [Parabacteroides sp.]|nr:glycoside hydrolase family 127 protein [Parabacteroides sp.]
PSNICRFIPSLPGYIYAVHDEDLYVNLFMSNTSAIQVKGKKVQLTQSTGYPWSGDVQIDVTPKGKQHFTLKVRIPGWVQGEVVPSRLYTYVDHKQLNYQVKVNGTPVEAPLEKGYLPIRRDWKKGDRVEIHFDMEPRLVKASQKVEADRGRVAVEKGPVVYCAEWPDNDFSVLSVLMNQKPQLTVKSCPDLLYGLDQIQTSAQALSYDKQGRLTTRDVTLTLIPYYAWAHRGSGEMAVWLPQEMNATRPTPQPTLASEATVSASHQVKSLRAVKDGLSPKDENDRTVPYYSLWPEKNSTQWVVYDLAAPATVSRAMVYWFDDAPWGDCRVPQSWKLYYKDAAGQWQPVVAKTAYGLLKGELNEVSFEPVKTSALKLEMQLQTEYSSGLFEWKVE